MTIPLAICIAGLVVWFICARLKWIDDAWLAEVGKLSFFCGLLVTLLGVTAKTVF